HCAVALPRDGGLTRGGSTQRGGSDIAVLHYASAVVLVEAARCISGPATQAVVELGAPPRGLPTVVDRRTEHHVTGPGGRTDRRALETMVPTPQEAARPLGAT